MSDTTMTQDSLDMLERCTQISKAFEAMEQRCRDYENTLKIIATYSEKQAGLCAVELARRILHHHREGD